MIFAAKKWGELKLNLPTNPTTELLCHRESDWKPANHFHFRRLKTDPVAFQQPVDGCRYPSEETWAASAPAGKVAPLPPCDGGRVAPRSDLSFSLRSRQRHAICLATRSISVQAKWDGQIEGGCKRAVYERSSCHFQRRWRLFVETALFILECVAVLLFILLRIVVYVMGLPLFYRM